MTTCHLHASGLVELYFYGELDFGEHENMARHLTGCAECRRALDDLQTIRIALAARPDVAAPEGGDWAPFMARLDAAVRRGALAGARSPIEMPIAPARRRSYVAYLATAALLALVTVSVLVAWRSRERTVDLQRTDVSSPAAPAMETAGAERSSDSAFAALSGQHFERSKLVVLGLATKDPADAAGADWAYERSLAGTLLHDTRIYRLAAEERGLSSLARVMQDLELVLLQASMSDKPDAQSLEQLQRLIRKRDLVTKMDVVATTAGI